MLEIEEGVEVGLDIREVTGITSRQHDDGHRVAVGLRDAAEGVLRARAVLHGEDADAVARGHLGDGVAHVQADALLAHDDGSDVGLGRRLDDRVDGVADDEVDAFALQDLGNHAGDVHGCFLLSYSSYSSSTATARTGLPVPPRILSGNAMNLKRPLPTTRSRCASPS